MVEQYSELFSMRWNGFQRYRPTFFLGVDFGNFLVIWGMFLVRGEGGFKSV
jgi:hypothetical protein